MVAVMSVEVVPDAISAVEGDKIQLLANVHDERDEPLSAAGVLWSSDDPAIASVDGHGLVEAHAPGSVVVRATFQGVSGETDVQVLRGPFPQVADRSVTLYAAPGVSPGPEVVAVTNGGGGSLEGLSVVVQHGDGQPGDWLSAELSGTSAPAQLTLSAASSALAAGMYDAQARVSSTSVTEAIVIDVALSIAGFTVTEAGGSTAVSEGGGAQELSVVLSARPAAAVVLSINSTDPGEVSVSPASLRFTASNWNTPRGVTVRGVDDADDDGDQTAEVIVSVDVGQSHDAFGRLADRIVTVANADDDDSTPPRLVVRETGSDTRVAEEGTYDSITVSLATRPPSNVLLSVSSDDPSEVAVTSSGVLTFTPANWSIPQVVVVRGVDDLADDGNRDVRVRVAVISSLSADVYDGLSASVEVRNQDDDRGGRGRRGGGGDDDDDDDDDDDGK